MRDPRAALVHAHFTHPEAVARYAARADQGLRKWEQTIVDQYFQPPGRLLDIGCGGGREAFALADLGYLVTAVDLSEAQIRSARATSLELGLDITFQLVDGQHFFLPDGSFDHILIASQALGNVPGAKGRSVLLTECARLLAPSGMVAFSAHNRSVVEAQAREHGNWVDDHGLALDPGDVITREPGADPASSPCYYHYFEEAELRDLLADAGLQLVALGLARDFGQDDWDSLFIGVAQPARPETLA